MRSSASWAAQRQPNLDGAPVQFDHGLHRRVWRITARLGNTEGAAEGTGRACLRPRARPGSLSVYLLAAFEPPTGVGALSGVGVCASLSLSRRGTAGSRPAARIKGDRNGVKSTAGNSLAALSWVPRGRPLSGGRAARRRKFRVRESAESLG